MCKNVGKASWLFTTPAGFLVVFGLIVGFAPLVLIFLAAILVLSLVCDGCQLRSMIREDGEQADPDSAAARELTLVR